MIWTSRTCYQWCHIIGCAEFGFYNSTVRTKHNINVYDFVFRTIYTKFIYNIIVIQSDLK